MSSKKACALRTLKMSSTKCVSTRCFQNGKNFAKLARNDFSLINWSSSPFRHEKNLSYSDSTSRPSTGEMKISLFLYIINFDQNLNLHFVVLVKWLIFDFFASSFMLRINSNLCLLRSCSICWVGKSLKSSKNDFFGIISNQALYFIKISTDPPSQGSRSEELSLKCLPSTRPRVRTKRHFALEIKSLRRDQSPIVSVCWTWTARVPCGTRHHCRSRRIDPSLWMWVQMV